ncbi:ABC transporter permease [Streptomyces sp. NPDC058052]|uniref:ABC transporter permease n=1 Tax=Streptomyces sp. NPDC058052 TaxID=3346316 RepID=UPI0036EB318E
MIAAVGISASSQAQLLQRHDVSGASGDLRHTVRRSRLIPEEETGGIAVKAATEELLDVVRGATASGTWLNSVNGRYPSVVLGHVAAQRLGNDRAGRQVWIDDRYFTVVGILDPLPLAPEIERSTDTSVRQVQRLLAPTIDPRNRTPRRPVRRARLGRLERLERLERSDGSDGSDGSNGDRT